MLKDSIEELVENKTRVDYNEICNFIPDNVKVLDLGCGDGGLLQLLKEKKNIKGQGIEINPIYVMMGIKKGLSVLQTDIEDGLKEYPDNSFDYVVMNQTLQSVNKPLDIILEMLRVGKFAIVGFPNFAYYRLRFSLLFTGRMPVSGCFPYEWYETPNIHPFTIKDFCKLLDKTEKLKVVYRAILGGNIILRKAWPNMFGKSGLFVLSNK